MGCSSKGETHPTRHTVLQATGVSEEDCKVEKVDMLRMEALTILNAQLAEGESEVAWALEVARLSTLPSAITKTILSITMQLNLKQNNIPPYTLSALRKVLLYTKFRRQSSRIQMQKS